MSTRNTEGINPESLIIIQEPGFLAIVWTIVAVSFLFLAFRAYVRIRVFGRFLLDDAFILLAWLCLLTCTILWHVEETLSLVYTSFLVGYGAEAPTVYFITHLKEWGSILFAEAFLHLIGLWSVKFSFLAFFRKLSKDIKGDRILWWVVTVLTVISLAISIGINYFPCIFPKASSFRRHGVPLPKQEYKFIGRFGSSLDATLQTDFLIMLIPVKILWKVRMSMRQKLGLIGLFSLVAVTMVFSLVKVVVALRGKREDDVWFFLCSTIENGIAIIVACLVSYRALYSTDKPTTTRPYDKYNTHCKEWNTSRKHTALDSFDDSYANVISSGMRNKNGGSGSTTRLTSDSNGGTSGGIEVIPLDTINVESKFEVIHSDHPGANHSVRLK